VILVITLGNNCEIKNPAMPHDNPSGNSTQPITVEEQFRIMADTAPVMIWISGTDKLCYFFNQGWLTFTGRTMEQEYGNGWAEGVHPDDLDRCLGIYVNFFDARKEFKMEYRLKRHDGAYRWLLDNGVPRYTANGEFAGYIGSCTDIDVIKQAEQNQESIVNHRTMELQQAVQELQRSNEELEQFAYAASHDMKEPIRKIAIFSESILSNPENSETYVTKIKGATNRMTTLIDQLLDLSRVRKDLNLFEEVNLNDTLKDVKNDLELSISEKNVIIHNELLPTIRAIPQQMQQLFLNLLSNSLKYSKKDVSPVINITVREYVSDQDKQAFPLAGKKFELVIADNGIGFDAADSEKIFSIFQRLHTREQFPGTGVGLALCKKVVQNHNGEIFAVSELNKGAAFHVILPQ
jgi:two-component system CheB/CheR fusion protein